MEDKWPEKKVEEKEEKRKKEGEKEKIRLTHKNQTLIILIM